MKKIFFSMLFLTFFVGNTFAQQKMAVATTKLNTAKLDSLFNLLETNNKSMGSLAISENGKVIYSKSIGFSDIENKVKPNENTKYRIGSISKMFTSVLIFKAIEEKKLTLDDKIDVYFPTLENAKIINPKIVQTAFNKTTFLRNKSLDSKGWILDILNCIEKIPNNDFTLKDIYNFEKDLKAKYPNNNFIKDKIRQQLQLLRDRGIIEFNGRGIYKKTQL